MLRSRLGGSYGLWWLYHRLVADAVALQKPTKFPLVYEYLGGPLGVAADLGCGPGVFTRYLSRHAQVVWAGDVNLSTLRSVRARHRQITNVRFVATELSRLPFAEGAFDTILLLEVLEHLQDDAGALRELVRVLKPGGRLVLSVPVPPGEIHADDPWGHKREGYSWTELRELLQGSGLKAELHGYAQFRFSRWGAKALGFWARTFRVPAPIFLSWVCYLDHLLDAEERRAGGHLPSSIVVLARKPLLCPAGDPDSGSSGEAHL